MIKKLSLLVAVLFIVTAIFPANTPAVFAEGPLIPGSVAAKYDFENGSTQGWAPKGSVTIAFVNEEKNSGVYSLKTTGRTANWNGPSVNVKGILMKNAAYTISGYVKRSPGQTTPSTLKFSMEQKAVGASTAWITVGSQAITGTDWTKISGTYSFTQDLASQLLYVESSNETEDFYIDDVTIKLDLPSSRSRVRP